MGGYRTHSAGVVGPYHLGNFGDDLIGLVLARHLKRMGFKEVWMHGIGESNAMLAEATVRPRDEIVRRANLVVIGGGHILGDGSHLPSVHYQRLAFLVALIRRVMGMRTVICGVGAGPLALRRSRLYARLACRLVASVGVRDPHSAAFVMQELRCPRTKVVEGADLALLWPEMFGFEGRMDGERNEVGVQIDWVRQTQPARFEIPRSDIDNYVGCVRYLSNGRKTTRAKSLFGIAGIETNYTSMLGFLDALLHCRAVITTHLHIAIAAYAARIPGFTLAINSKTRRFYEQIGHPERCFDLAECGEGAGAMMGGILKRVTGGVEWTASDEARLEQLRVQSRRLLAGIGDNLDAKFTTS